MEINATGFSPKELAPNRAGIEQQQAQRTIEKNEQTNQVQKQLEPRPVNQTDSDKNGRIDIYV